MTTRYESSVESLEICGEIATLRISRPDGFDFHAGQWIRLGVSTPAGLQDRTLTVASAPADPWIEVTTRLSESDFKRALGGLQPADNVIFTGPGGRLRLDPDVSTAAFLVGGVGITPARSILRDAVQHGRSFDEVLLFYGNRSPECVPYAAELRAMSDSGVSVIEVFEEAPASWAGPRGFIDAELVRSHMGADDGRTFFVAGPPVMVGAMEQVLDELGVGEQRRVVERFGPTTRGIG